MSCIPVSRRSRTATCISAPPKAIFINYTIAKHYGGLFNLRFDDTNPAREGDEYVQSILQDLKWLGAEPNGGIFYGSDYF